MRGLFESKLMRVFGCLFLLSLLFNLYQLTYLVNSIDGAKEVAKVDKKSIVQAQLYDTLLTRYGKVTIDDLVADEVIRTVADKENINVTLKEINAEYDRIGEQFGGTDKLKEAIKTKEGMTVSEFKNNIRVILLKKKIIEPLIKVTDEEIEEHFKENKSKYKQQEKVQASHILVKTEEEAEKLYKELNGKSIETFQEKAKQVSIDTGTSKEGGELGLFTKTQVDKTFANRAFAQKVGTITKPFKTSYGYHIVYVTAHFDKKPVTAKDVRNTIVQELKSSKVDSTYNKWLKEQKKKLGVETFLSK